MGRTKWDWARFDHLSWVFDHSSRGSCHLKEGEQSLRAKTYLAMESVNSLRISAPPWWPVREGREGKCEGRNEKCEFLARESVSSSPIVRIFGKGKCKFIANFSATMVTSLPSISLSLSVSLSISLSPKVPHAQYRKRFRASYNADRQRERQKWRHHCRAKIGDEFTLSLAKNSHNWWWAYTFPCQKFALFVSLFTLPVSPFTERSPLWRWNSQLSSHFPLPKVFSPTLFPLFQMARAARRVIENPRQMIKSCPVLFCSSHGKNESN